MLKKLFIGLLLLALLAVAALAWLRHEPAPEKRAFVGGQVLTMDADNRIAQALLMDEGRIVAVGSVEEIRALADDDTRITELAGRTLIPGFVDAHSHFPATGLKELTVDLNSPPIGEIQSIEDMQQRLSALAADTPQGEWLVGIGYDDSLVAEKRHPTREDLDAVSTDHPIFILHVSGHMAVVNTPGLAKAGIDDQTPDPDGGVIVRDEAGRATGLLQETAAEPVREMAFDYGLGEFVKMIHSATQDYARAGVTTAQSGGANGQLLNSLSAAVWLRQVPQRLVVMPYFSEVKQEILSGELDLPGMHNHRFSAPGVKLVADGSIQGYTGYLSEPYHVPYKGDADYRGYPTLDQQALNEAVAGLHRRWIQMAIHANGDAAIDAVIDAFAAAQAAHPAADPRLIVIHAQMAREDQLQRMAELGMTPSFFSAHTYYWGDRHRDIFMGPERAANMSPARWALDRGVRFSVHLDSPVVPMEPLRLLWATVNRISSGGYVIGPSQRIDAMAALRAMTIDAAWQVFEDHNRGSLEPGKWADLVILSGDPLGDPAEILDLRVDETIIGGRSVYVAGPP